VSLLELHLLRVLRATAPILDFVCDHSTFSSYMRSHLFLIFYAIVPFYILYTIAPFRFSYAIALNLRFCMRPHLFVCDRALSYAIAPLSKFVCGRVFFYVIASFLGFCMRSRLLVHDRGSFKSCMRSLPFCPLMPLFVRSHIFWSFHAIAALFYISII
jgi:hypothetical protein